MRLLPLLLVLFGFSQSIAQQLFHEPIMELAERSGSRFPFGVASGDPRPDRVMLWVKVLPDAADAVVKVDWQIAKDTGMLDIVTEGTSITDSTTAFSVSAEPEGLQAGTTYFYRFISLGDTSAIGRTRTATDDDRPVRFAVATCANFGAGYFNAYGHLAQRNDIDAVLFLGDYIYEYGMRSYMFRPHIPDKEILTLKDYRSRYAQYRLDTNLMEAHRLHPFITIWDDHEFANDSYATGAQNHAPQTEGTWENRAAIARQVFFEWLPTMQPRSRSIIRSLRYGNMAELFMIDGRVEGRDVPVRDFLDSITRFDTTRSMLGEPQLKWLIDGLERTDARWPVLVNNVMFAPMDLGSFAKHRRFNMDAWDGYPADRDRIFDVLQRDSIRNLVVVTGDIHTAWAIELTRSPLDKEVYDRKRGKGVFGAEFVTPSISSPNLDEMRGKLAARLAVPYLKGKKRNPHLRYANMMDHGYMLLDLNEEEARATWVYMRTLKRAVLKTKRSRSWAYPYNGLRLEKRRKP